MTGTAAAPPATEAVIAAATAELRALFAKPLTPGLYLVSTPIGNLGDLSLRALTVLALADRIACEDTRHSRRLLDRYRITNRLTPYHEHNAERERPRLLAALAEGARIALISDAGTPLISDPGYKLVQEAIAAGLSVTAIPGPSAPLAALTLAGLPTHTFSFGGFLPPKRGPRQARLRALAAAAANGTLVLFEAPGRVLATLTDMAQVLGPERPAALARELTKLHETVLRGNLGTLVAELTALAAAGEPVRGECVLLVAPAPGEGLAGGADADGSPGDTAVVDAQAAERLDTALRLALGASSVRDAARQVASELGMARGRVYARAVALSAAPDDG